MVRHPSARVGAAVAVLLSIASFVEGRTTLLQFTSPSCAPCRRMRPAIRRFAAAGRNVRIVDVSAEPQTANRYRVNAWPTSVLLVDGVERARHVGPLDYQQLVHFVGTAGPAATYSSAPPRSPQPSAPFDIQQAATQTRSQTAVAASQSELIKSTVRLSVDDPQGRSSGTGTIIDAFNGEALILTCGHIFRESQGQGEISVTLFDADARGVRAGETVAGRLIDFDLDRDLGLVAIRPQSAVRVAPVAPNGTPLTPGASVVSVGCNHGADPTAQATRITTVDRYVGTPNVEIAGAPVEGRSGGGLFNAQGQVIGVCFAADPEGDEGLYASLRAIHAKLDERQLSVVYQQPSETRALQASVPASANGEPPARSFAVLGQDSAMPQRQDPAAESTFADDFAKLSLEQQATLEELAARGADAEVVCIIRPKTPDGASEIIQLNNASPEFLAVLKTAFQAK